MVTTELRLVQEVRSVKWRYILVCFSTQGYMIIKPFVHQETIILAEFFFLKTA